MLVEEVNGCFRILHTDECCDLYNLDHGDHWNSLNGPKQAVSLIQGYKGTVKIKQKPVPVCAWTTHRMLSPKGHCL